MFGFMKPVRRSNEYRKLYCDSCAHMRQNFGRRSTSFLSYESVLAHAMAFDVGLIAEENTVSPCRIVALPKLPQETSDPHRRIGEFSSALTHLLVRTKLDDDIHDDRSWRARITRRMFRKQFDQCVRYFAELDPAFEKTLEAFFETHRDMELKGSAVSLDEYARPTADAFGYVFGLLGTALNDTRYTEVFSGIGEQIGRAIIFADCGHDWIRDKKKGLFNPVKTLEDSAQAIAASQAALREGAQVASRSFGENGVTEQILIDVHDRLYRVIERNKKYHPYLVPLQESSRSEATEKKSNGIIMASNAACPTLALFAQGDCGACLSCGCCLLILLPLAGQFLSAFCGSLGEGCAGGCK